jgi:DNA-binding transcriptional LysR family regulator
MDRIDCLRAFVRTLETGSFSAAAKELGIGQPAVSKRIRLLEAEFGVQLFLRTTRTVRPTSEADRIYEIGRQILDNFDEAREGSGTNSPRPTGTLRVSLPSSFGRRFMMPVIAEYLRLYPEVRIDLRFSERNVNLAEEGVELALRIGPIETSTLVARRLGTVRRVLVATPAYLNRLPLPTTPLDLAAHQCIITPTGVNSHEWVFDSEHGRHAISVNGSILVDDAHAVAEAVKQDLGIAILPEWIACEGLRSGALQQILPDYTIASLPIHAVYLETQWMSLRARRFLDLLVLRADWLTVARLEPAATRLPA